MKVIIEGFKDEKAARAFISWYEGQGEQDIDLWTEHLGYKPGSFTMDMSASFPLKVKDNEIKIKLQQ